MRINNTAIPIHIARAYGIEQAITVARTPSAANADATNHGQGEPARAKHLVAGVVPGRVDFSANQPTPSAQALAMYRHPADRNAAATSIDAGRVIDTTA